MKENVSGCFFLNTVYKQIGKKTHRHIMQQQTVHYGETM